MLQLFPTNSLLLFEKENLFVQQDIQKAESSIQFQLLQCEIYVVGYHIIHVP
jgi:hypothetical protein